eukprot:SAG11_NODE_764_length_7290_cov_9.187596_6_plen_105_part_00
MNLVIAQCCTKFRITVDLLFAPKYHFTVRKHEDNSRQSKINRWQIYSNAIIDSFFSFFFCAILEILTLLNLLVVVGTCTIFMAEPEGLHVIPRYPGKAHRRDST